MGAGIFVVVGRLVIHLIHKVFRFLVINNYT
jgi:hypothetical protein